MPSTTKTTISILLLLGVMHPQLSTCAPGKQIPERFFYNNNNERAQLRDNAMHDTAAHASSSTEDADTKLKLLEESRTDPIPLAFYEQMNNITEISDFLHLFVAEDSLDPKLGIQEKISNNVERAAANIPKPAGCIPDSAIVELVPLNPSTESDIFYHPKCTRVKRCSGCCNSPLLSCQPIEEEVIDFQVIKYRYVGAGKKMRAEGQEHVLVNQHTRCKCDCRIKKEDCNSYQVYDPSQCRCICTNSDAREKCLAQDEKLWDYETCKCGCRDAQSCTTGTLFDESQCKCIEPFVMGQYFVIGSIVSGSYGPTTAPATLLDRRRFIVKAIPVETDNSTIYDTES